MRRVRLFGWFALPVLAAVGLYALLLAATNNFHTVIAGRLYRSAQPSAAEIATLYARYGIRTIVNLRGAHPEEAWYRDELAAAEKSGIALLDYPLSSSHDLKPGQIEDLIALLGQAQGPILVHCRNGADRSGIVSALYVAAVARGSEFFAELQLSPIFGHLPVWFMPAYAMDRSWEKAEPRLGFLDS
jgi:uncharacterized protein (TIGR01244 family)